VNVGGYLIHESVAVPFFEKARELGLNKTDAITAAMAAFVGVPLDRQEALPLT
jgi:hypothetical protein